MARVRNVELKVDPDPGDIQKLKVTIDYDVAFSVFDVNTDLQYRQECRIVGVDGPNEQGGPAHTPITFFPPVVSSGGSSTKHQAHVFFVARSRLNEDIPSTQNPDELRLRCTIDPLLPAQTSASSDVYEVTIN